MIGQERDPEKTDLTTGASILVIEDSPTQSENLRFILEKHQYIVRVAFNGIEALAMINESKPDLIISDVMMPDMDGFDFCRKIKSIGTFADIPVIFLTVVDKIEGELKGFEAGGIDYISKPINPDLLILRVHNHMALKRQSDLIRNQRDLLIRQKEDLEASLDRIKRLEGIIPICMHCKSIRSNDESWQKIEHYISEHTDASFSHGICPDCIAQHYPNIAE